MNVEILLLQHIVTILNYFIFKVLNTIHAIIINIIQLNMMLNMKMLPILIIQQM